MLRAPWVVSQPDDLKVRRPAYAPAGTDAGSDEAEAEAEAEGVRQALLRVADRADGGGYRSIWGRDYPAEQAAQRERREGATGGQSQRQREQREQREQLWGERAPVCQ